MIACLPQSHFPDITDTIARRELGCPSLVVTELEPYAFRADVELAVGDTPCQSVPIWIDAVTGEVFEWSR